MNSQSNIGSANEIGADTQKTDWAKLAIKAARKRNVQRSILILVLVLISLPILLPYLWMVLISFTARTGGVDSGILWQAVGILLPSLGILMVIQLLTRARRTRAIAYSLTICGCIGLLAVGIGSQLHLQNYRFLVNPNIIEDVRGAATAGGQFPWVWTAFTNSLLVASLSTLVKVTVAVLAGYYLSRFSFRGRAGLLKSLLVIEAFPAVVLTIPIFIVVYFLGLLNTLWGPILVISALDIPFYIFIMKGFFDAVPWDIEMAALTDGASRRQAFRHVVLPQVIPGIFAIGTFAFIRGWEEYVFVTALRTGNSYWVMSTYLYYVAEDIMGVDYGMVAAVAVFYVLPSLILYVSCQKYLTQMSFGGVKG